MLELKTITIEKNSFDYRRKNINYFIDKNGCWICTSHATANKYPRMRLNMKKVFVHRYMYEKFNGTIPEGLVVRHKCDNPQCINPEHLEVGTHKDNSQDMVKRGRCRNGQQTGNARILIGEENPSAKLTELQVSSIKKSKLSQRKLARIHNVSQRQIGRILNNLSWAHVA